MSPPFRYHNHMKIDQHKTTWLVPNQARTGVGLDRILYLDYVCSER